MVQGSLMNTTSVCCCWVRSLQTLIYCWGMLRASGTHYIFQGRKCWRNFCIFDFTVVVESHTSPLWSLLSGSAHFLPVESLSPIFPFDIHSFCSVWLHVHPETLSAIFSFDLNSSCPSVTCHSSWDSLAKLCRGIDWYTVWIGSYVAH